MSDFWAMPGRSRIGMLDGGSTCVGLSTPWVLWDTRLHDGTNFPKVDGQYGVMDNLTNQGAGPSPEFDLEFEEVEYNNGNWVIIPYKTYNWPNNFGTSGTPPFPADWADFGGNFCDGGGVTLMIPMSEFTREYYNGVLVDYLGFVEAEILVDNDPDAYNNIFMFADMLMFGMDLWNDVVSDPVGDGFMEIDSLAASGIVVLDTESEVTGRHYNPENTLWTLHLDPNERRVYAWRGTEEILRLTVDDDNFMYSFVNEDSTCRDDYGAPTATVGELFMYCGEYGPAVNFPGIGYAYNPLKGYALFRGCIPTKADLEYWQSYWYPGNDQLATPRQYLMDRFTPTLNNTDSHFEEVTVPAGYSVAGIGVRTANSNQSVSFALDVSPGDVIRVELGGQGTLSPATVGTPVDGAGGWPDGGQGGISTPGGTRSQGGGGSTRVYLNGSLRAIVGAGGGASTRATRTSTNSRAAIFVGGIPGKVEVTVNGGPGNGTQPGGGGTAVAGGAAGGAGATAGTAVSGGSGAPNSYAGSSTSFWYNGGGGGGGGAFGGGGGGAGNTSTPSSGGAGSHWVHGDCQDVHGFAGTAAWSTTAATAYVTLS